jgi:hypothetical protein
MWIEFFFKNIFMFVMFVRTRELNDILDCRHKYPIH